MSSKTGPEPRPPDARPWSLAARLTVWYAASSFALVLVVAVVLYGAFSAGLEHEDDRMALDMVQIVREMLRAETRESSKARDLIEWELAARRNERIYVRILDGQGRMQLETPGMGTLLPPGAFAPLQEGREPFSRVTASGGAPFRACTAGAETGAGEPRVLQVAIEFEDDEQIMASHRARLWVLLGVALVACAIAGYAVARSGIRPVRAIAEATRRVRSENLRERIDPAGLPSELGDLAGTFNEMLDRLEDSFGRLSRFSADLAHELRTPVNRLRGEAEVVLARDRSPGEYREALASCLEECVRLSELIDQLLFLARAEDPRTQVERTALNVARELASTREFYGPSAEEAGIRLEVDPVVDVEIRADAALLRRAVGNLVANALAHTPRGGRVSLAVRPAADAVRLEVRDTGRGIPAEHLPRIFDRFYRADGARSAGAGGSGLGLAIVKSIMALHGGRVEIESVEGTGTRVALVFPRDHDGKVIPASSPV